MTKNCNPNFYRPRYLRTELIILLLRGKDYIKSYFKRNSTKTCKSCSNTVAKKAIFCPKCGIDVRSKIWKALKFILIIAVILFAMNIFQVPGILIN